MSFEIDVADPRAVELAIRDVERELGPIRGLVTAAGHYASVPFTEVADEAASRMLHVHLGGFISAARAVLPAMITRQHGSIVAISSELAVGGGVSDSHYAAAKGAVLGAVRSLAVEVARFGVRVNAVAPGPTDTALLSPDSPWRDPAFLASLPTRALATPKEIALCVEFLLEESGFITGETLSPNSGAVI